MPDNALARSFRDAAGELNQAVYTQRDATFRGAEFQAQFDVAPSPGHASDSGLVTLDGTWSWASIATTRGEA